MTHFVWADHYSSVGGTSRDIKENKRKKELKKTQLHTIHGGLHTFSIDAISLCTAMS